MQWTELKKIDAAKIVNQMEEEYKKGNDPLDGHSYSNLPPGYLLIREKLDSLFNKNDDRTRYGYSFDFDFGLKAYVYFRFEMGMTEADASNDDVWRFIQLRVVPDLMMKRWPIKNGQINAKRLYSEPSRLYLKVLWWYIHILWDTDEKTTRSFKAQVDISQIIDRSGGSEGTPIELYKEILHVYSSIDSSKRANLIERVLMLDVSYRTTIEPQLIGNGLHDYVVKLYGDLGVYVE